MTSCWPNSVRKCLLPCALVFPTFLYGAEPVFLWQETPVPALLSPDTLPSSFYTYEPEDIQGEPRDSLWLDFSNWVIHQERQHGETIQALGAWADRTLSASSHSLPNNESYLRLGLATESEYGDPAQFEPEVRFRLDVPTARKKFRLIIDSESEDQIPLSERERDRQLTDADRTDTETIGALRYLSQVGDAINLSSDLGGRLRFPPEMFWRLKAGSSWQITSDWNMAVEQRVYYYHTEGWGARSWLGAERPIGNGWSFSTSSELEWLHDERKFEAAQIASVHKRLNNRSRIRPRIGILGESQPSWRTTSYFADLTWRYRLYENWLYAELIPALTFPRDEDFKDQGSVLFRIEMYFAGTIDRD